MDSFDTRNEFADAQDGGNADTGETQGNATPAMAVRPGDVVLQPDANGVVVLPEGASLENMSAEGRDLVIVLDDGSRVIIPEGAIIVPQIVVDGVTVPAANLAALLTGNEPQPAAGDPQSSGGNFEVDPGNIQDAYAIGNLLPYTELQFPQPEEREVIPYDVEEDPVIVIETPDNPVGVINAIATVDEDGLPARTVDGVAEAEGTREETNSETAAGTIVFDAPDGVGSVQINGVDITEVGQTFQGELGLLTITSINLAGGEIGFSYTLEDNMLDNGLDGSFVMTVFDVDGDRADATLQINVVDDAPIAQDDVAEVAPATHGPVTGDVLVNDESGSDGYATSGAVSGFSNAGGSANAGETLTGTYGELTLNADGSYSYTRFFNTPGGVSEDFTYTVVDGDGSTSTATLTINIGDAPDAITEVPSGPGVSIVDEDQLPPTTGSRDDEPEGSEFDGDDETATGTITFTSPDGVGSVSLGGTVIDPDNLPQVVVSDDTGTLTVTGYTYDPATGEGTITYVYTLTDNTDDPDGTTVEFPIVITDLDGDVAEDDLVITIVDDTPEALDDFAAQDPENAPVTVDALDNDVTGADGVDLATGVAVVDGTLSGGGSVAYNGDGTFTYTPAAGEEGTVTFDYVITDGDGDTSTATVTITLQPDSTPEIGVTGEDTVFEEALAARDGEPAGSNEASDGEFASGNINITTGGDTVDTLVINGVDVTAGGTVTTDRGVLTVTLNDGQYSYSYELTDNTSGDATTDNFTLVVTDSDGDTAQTTLVMNIVDDMPSAEDDANTIAAGEYGPVGGNVLVNDTEGADAAVVTSYTGVGGSGSAGDTIQGEYGTLTIAADGTYSYTRDAGTDGGVTDTFSYTITDGDGDTATANLVITILDSPVVLDLPVVGGDGTLVDEAGLATGSDAASDSEFTSGTFTYDAPDGPATVTVNGTVVAVGETITGSFGTLTITSVSEGSVGYTYELTTNTSGDDTLDSFAVVVTDKDGDFDAGSLEIAIVDDVPTAVADADSVTEDGPLTADGNVITNAEANGDNGADTTGADGASVTAVAFGGADGTVGGATAGAYGSLVLNADGSYVYTLDNTNEYVQGLDETESLTETFTYTLTDGDGDTSVTTLTVTINGADDPVVINGLDLETPELTVDEDDLSDGSSPDAAALVQSGQFTVDSPDGLDTLTVGGVQVWGAGETYPISVNGQYGEVRITDVDVTLDANGDVVAATVSYEYELSDNTLDHDEAGEDNLVDSLEVVATDSDGSQDTASLDIEVVDDVPNATDNTNSVTEGDSTSGNLLTDDDGFGVDISGADGPLSILDVSGTGGSDDGAPFVVTGSYGELTVQADGSYTYQSFANATNMDVTDSFTYRIVDADGDIAEATLDIDITDVAGAVDDDGATVNEAGLSFGSDAASDSEVDADGQITVTNATGDFTYVLTSPATGTYGTLVLDADTGAYTYTLTTNVDGDGLAPSQGGDNDANTVTGQESFTYEVYDDLNNFIGTGTIQVDIVDDVPTAVADTDTVSEGSSVTGNVVDNDTIGADSAEVVDNEVTGVAAGSDTTNPVSGNVGVSVDGLYGTITINADGSYTYDSDPNAVIAPGATDTFTYTITDGDGDTSTTTISIDVTDVTLVADNDTITVDEDGLPVIGSAAATDSETAGGTLDVNGAVSYALVGSGTGSNGTLTLNANGTYSYTLATPVDGMTADNDENTVPGVDSFTYVATDADGNTVQGTITIDVIDDVPTARADTDTVSEGSSVTGDVLANDTIGADSAEVVDNEVTGVAAGSDTSNPVSGNVGMSVDGLYGTITINADGSYTYDSDPDAVTAPGATDTFTYTITDGDGDTSTTTISIDVTDVTLVADNDTITVDEDGLPVIGSAAATDSETAGGTLDVNGAVSYALVGSGTGSNGTLTLNANGTYSYTLATPVDGMTADNDENTVPGVDSFTYVATDADGNTVQGTITIDVIDDVPTARADTDTLSEDTASVSGDVLTNDTIGADSAEVADNEVTGVASGSDTTNPVSGNVGGSVGGTYGTLTLNADGSYTYNLNTAAVQYLDDTESVVDTFTYTITDGDGDTSTTTLAVTITGDNDAPVAADDTNWVMAVTTNIDPTTSGNVLESINHPGAPSGSFADVADTDVDGDVLTVSGVTGGTVGNPVTGSFGSIVINGDGSYTYTLDNDNLLVLAIDDGESITDTFTYTVTDGDVTDTATVTITIFGTNNAPTVGVDAVAVSDEGLAGGNQDTSGTPGDTTNSTTASGQVAIGDPDGPEDIEAVTLGTPTGDLSSGGETVLWDLQDDGQTLLGYTGDLNGVFTEVVRVTIDNDGNFDVTQYEQIDHTYGDGVEGIDTITIPVTADDGTTQTTNANGITVVFEDDSPIIGTFSPDTTTVANVANATASGTFDYSPGGDGHGSFIINAAAIDGVTYSTVQVDTNNDGVNDQAILTGSVDGTDIFTLEVNVDGTYTYTLLEPELSTSEDLSFSQLAAGGPGFRELNDDENTAVNENGRVEFTSNGTGVNANNNNFGVSNSFLDAGEWFEAEFHNPGTDGDDPALTDAEFLSSIDVNINTLRDSSGPNPGGDSRGPNVTLEWTAYNDATGESESGTVTVTSTGAINIDPSIEFNRINIENVDQLGVSNDGGRIQIAGFTIYKTVLPQDQEFNFTVSALDSDGDPTGTVADLSVTLDADQTNLTNMEGPGKLAAAQTLDLAVNDNEVFASSLTNQTTSDPRFDMRGMEMATVAAMASGFFMPEVMTDLSQTFGSTASAGGHMVNFEFAGGLDMAAVQLPEAYATSFEGFVETAPAMLEGPMMANILEGGAFDMPQFEAVAGIETGGFDFMADMAATSHFAGGPSVFEGFAGNGEAANAMEALLMLQAPAQLTEAAVMEPGKALGEAVADLAAEAQVDAIVDHFAIADAPAMAVTPTEGLLDSMVGHDMALYQTMGLPAQDQTDEAAALAAASA